MSPSPSLPAGPCDAFLPERLNVLGVGVHATNMPTALDQAEQCITQGRQGYIFFRDVHGIVRCQQNVPLREIHNRGFLIAPDGMPLVWLGRLKGHRNMGRVYGPDFMKLACERSVDRGFTHFLYGGREGVAEQLKSKLEARFPGIRILGTYTPPFRPLNTSEAQILQTRIEELRPDYFWVGISTPKQELFMAEYLPRLDTRIMCGVGAAFDIHADLVREAPDWVKRSGLQWLHRIIQEPRRLIGRYLVCNSVFLWKLGAQLLGLKKYSLSSSKQLDSTIDE